MRYDLIVRKTAIFDQEADAILIPTTRDLVVGGNFGAALARTAGPEFQAACRRLAPIELGDAAVTTAGNLKALTVIHAACISLGQTTKSLIRGAYTSALQLADRGGVRSIVTPPLAIPATGMTLAETTEMLVKLLKRRLDASTAVREFIFAVIDVGTFEAYSAACRGQAPREGGGPGPG
jgi:O-acetyl-ADP-ribose deacetylase (regulator of RNase III)